MRNSKRTGYFQAGYFAEIFDVLGNYFTHIVFFHRCGYGRIPQMNAVLGNEVYGVQEGVGVPVDDRPFLRPHEVADYFFRRCHVHGIFNFFCDHNEKLHQVLNANHSLTLNPSA